MNQDIKEMIQGLLMLPLLLIGLVLAIVFLIACFAFPPLGTTVFVLVLFLTPNSI